MSPGILRRKAATAIRYGRQHGLKALLRLALRKLRHGSGQGFLARHDPLAHYAFVRCRPTGDPVVPGEVPPKSVNWFVPPFGQGSGGHLNVFRFIYHLEAQGFDCRIVIVGGPTVGDPAPDEAARVKAQIDTWFFPLKAEVFVGLDQAPPCHVAMATAWQTAYAVRDFRPAVHRCYFVQDFEPWFYPAGAEAAFAEQTYRFGFTGITSGTWLEEKLARDYGMTTHAVGFSYDHDRYRPVPRRETEERRVFFYARPPTPRRAFEMGLLVLDEVTRRLPDVKVVFAGWDLSGFEIPFAHLNAGVVSLDELADLYSQCDAALVLSFSNLSLLPLELMACGTPVVSNRGPNTEWLLNDEIAKLADPEVEALAAALVELLENPGERERLRQNGMAAAHATDWRRESERLVRVLESLDDEAGTSEPLRRAEAGQ